MRPLVVWALQAPTLLERLSRTDKWRLEVADLEDSDGNAENSLLSVPSYEGGRPYIVFVCTERQFANARRLFPGSRIIWVLHNGKDGPPSKVPERVAFSNHVARLHGGDVHVLVPAYEAKPRYEWKSDCVWTMMSRPQNRRPDRMRITRILERASGVPVRLYGQDQPGGFLDAEARESLMRLCTAYVSSLPDWAGFGLAEHECFEAGVPVIGNLEWGDMREENLGYRGLSETLVGQITALRAVATNPDFAMELSEAGIAFIDRCRSRMRMDRSIEALL